MSRVKFTPQLEEFVPASPPHPTDTFYRVAIGAEDRGGRLVEVEKVEMVHAGRVVDHETPSYPLASEDAELVREAQARVRRRRFGGTAPAQRLSSLVDLIGSARGLYGTPDDVLQNRDELRREWP